MDFTWALVIVPFISAGAGAYLGSYLKKKGANLATREDLDDLVEQMSAVTQATKAIEAQISDQAWNKQRHWEMKRDALFSAVQALGRADDTLISLITTHTAARNGTTEEWQDTKSDALVAWQTAINNYDEKRFIASLVCGADIEKAMRTASKEIRTISSKVFDEEVSEYSQVSASIQKAIYEVLTLARKELGVGVDTKGDD